MCFLCVARALLFFPSAATFGNTLYAAMRKKRGNEKSWTTVHNLKRHKSAAAAAVAESLHRPRFRASC